MKITIAGEQLDIPPTALRIYARTARSAENPIEEIKDQENICRERAAEEGLDVDESDIHVEEAGSSGNDWWSGAPQSGKRSRPVLGILMREVQEGKVRTVIVRDVYRLARSTDVRAAALKELKAHDVKLLDRNGPVDLDAALLSCTTAVSHPSLP